MVDISRGIRFAARHEVGVRRRPVEMCEIDEASFAEEFAWAEEDDIPAEADAAEEDDIPVQVVARPRQVDILARQGRAVAEVIRPVGVAEMTCATSRRHKRRRPAGRTAWRR